MTAFINYTRPARLHIIIRRDLAYLTLWLFGRRYHRSWGKQ